MPLRKFRYGGGIRHNPRNKKWGFLSPNMQNKDDLLSETLERIGKEFEGCEHELGGLSSQDRVLFLAQIVVHSLRYEDPQEPMKRFLRGFRKHRLNEKIVRYVAAGFDVTPYSARQMLISLLE